MEGAGAVGIFKRSIEKWKLTYIQFSEHKVSDTFKVSGKKWKIGVDLGA